MKNELAKAKAVKAEILRLFPNVKLEISSNFNRGIFINTNVRVEGPESVTEVVLDVVPDMCGAIIDRYDEQRNHLGTEIKLSTKPVKQ